MATAVPGNTPHLTRTLNIGAAAYKFIDLTTQAGDGGGKKKGVSYLKIKTDSNASIYVQPVQGDVSTPPTAWTATPEPGAGNLGEAAPIFPSDSHEFGVKPDGEEGSDQTIMLSGLHVWGKAAGIVGLLGI